MPRSFTPTGNHAQTIAYRAWSKENAISQRARNLMTASILVQVQQHAKPFRDAVMARRAERTLKRRMVRKLRKEEVRYAKANSLAR